MRPFERFGEVIGSLARPWRTEGVRRLFRYLPRVLKYLRPYWTYAVLSVIVSTAHTVVGLLGPWPMKIMVDTVLGNEPLPSVVASALGSVVQGPIQLILMVVAAQLLLALASNGLSVIGNYAAVRLELGMTLDFRSELFQHAQRLSLAYHDQRRSGMLIYIVNGMDSVPTSLIMTLLPLGQSVFTLVGMLWITYKIDPQLALLSMTVVPVLYYSVGYYVTHIQQRVWQVKQMEGDTLSIIHESLSMLRVIVAFGREDHEYSRMRTRGELANDARVGLTMRQTLFSLCVDVITAGGAATVLGVGAYHVLRGGLTVGELLIVISYIGSVYKPLEAISSTVASLQDQLIGLQMAFEIQDLVPEIQDAPGAATIERCTGRVTFEEVDFSYKTRTDTLKGVSFEAAPGSVVAIVGPTGAGKTTLISLIPRFYDATGGRILLDGRDVREITVRSLRDQVSLVLQEPMLFSGSIRDNIRYGRLDATDKDIIEAARAANADDFISALPKQYDTEVGERGAQLSGGERQRISVARAFLRDAPILILDEPTSSIDSKTEAVILEALERLMAGRTTFMVAHRLSTLRNAGLILVMNHGRLVEQGTHGELIALGGLYRQLHDLQSGSMKRKLQAVIQAGVPFTTEHSA